MKNTKTLIIISWALFCILLLAPLSGAAQSPPIVLSAHNPMASEFDWPLDKLGRRNAFAIKSNLLFDAVAAPNIEVELPLGNRYSIAAEWIFPWWLSDSSQRCFQLMWGNLEGRYWLGERSEQRQLLGWAVGFHLGVGYYDLEWDGVGYQGEHVVAGGLSATYAHSIGGAMRLEYSFGLGVLSTKYRKYEAQECGNDWNLLLQSRGHQTWFGPTRCRVSLVWMVSRADKRGGAR